MIGSTWIQLMMTTSDVCTADWAMCMTNRRIELNGVLDFPHKMMRRYRSKNVTHFFWNCTYSYVLVE
jgi:hypothetical protein